MKLSWQKRITIFMLVVALAGNVFAQKKDELVQRITQLENSVVAIQNSMNAMQNTIDNLNTSLKLATDANALLENKIKFQEEVNANQTATIQQLQKEVAELKKAKVDADPNAIITDPQNEEDSIISVIQQYCSAKKWEDRLAFVYKPEKVKPYMQKYYASDYRIITVDKTTVSIPGGNYKNGDKFIAGFRNKSGYALRMYMRKTTEGFKIDWEATCQYNEEGLRDYAAREGTDKIIVRVEFSSLNSADYEGYGVGSNYYGCYADDGNQSEPILFLKSSAVGQRIAQLVKGGNTCYLILEVQGQKKYSSYFDDTKYFIFVNRIVKEDWFSE